MPRRAADLDDRAELVFVEQEVARVGVRKTGSVRGARLDHVDAVIEVDLRGAANLLRRLESRCELEETRVGEDVARVLETRLQVDAGGQNVRSGKVSGLDHLAKRDVGEHRDAGAARGGDAGHQRHLRGRRVRDMGVSVDEAGQDRPASRVDDRRSSRRRGATDRRDRAIADDDRDIPLDRSRFDVEQPRVGDGDRPRRRRLAGEAGFELTRGEQRCDPDAGELQHGAHLNPTGHLG